MPDSPPPAYSQIDDDPFVDNPVTPTPSQRYGTRLPVIQPVIDYRALYGYGPEIPAPEDFVQPTGRPIDKKWYVVSVGQEIIITWSWSVAASKILRVPCAVFKTQPTWDRAVEHYKTCYQAGNVKVVEPRDPSSTPGRTASTAVTVHSAAPTPTRGDQSFPIYIPSSAIATPTTSTPRATGGGIRSPLVIGSSPVAIRDGGASPIYVSSSPVVTMTATPAENEDHQSLQTIHLHNYIDRAFAKMEAAKKEKNASASAPNTSQPAAWIDQTPISIPGAASSSRLYRVIVTDGPNVTPPSTPRKSNNTPGTTDGCDPTAPVTPRKSDNTSAITDGRDPTPPSTKHGKEKEIKQIDSDDDYFPDDFSDETLEKLYEWEQTLELQQALSSPRFD